MKNLLLILALLITYTTVYSQLYVKPNATSSTDSYIFVDNEVLFVEQDVNLTVNNNDPTTKASIYLRNQAQLVQGTTASANLGTGYISVMQNAPDDDSWDYSFWSSPVNNQLLGGSGNQKYSILRVHDSITLTNSVVTETYGGFNGVQSPLKISTRWLYRYPAGGPWNAIYTNDEIDPGYGFIMKGVGTINHNQIYDFRGRPNNGDMTVTVLANKYTLSGNPYPSALDLNRVFYDTSESDPDGTVNPGNNEINSIRFWDEDRSIDSHYYRDNKGGYGVWVPMGSSPNSVNPGAYTVAPFLNYDNNGNPSGGQTGTGASWERRYAPIGQGFMIFGQTNGSIIIKNKHRKYVVEGFANDSQYRDQEEANPNDDTESEISSVTDLASRTPYLRIYTIFGESHFRDMVLAFSDAATDLYDRGFDAIHPMDAASADAYFPIGEDNNRLKYVIQGLPFELSKEIPIAFTLDRQYNFTVKAFEEVNIRNAAYLWDRDENTYQKITGGGEATLNLPAGEYENRFFIVFKGNRQVIEESEGTLTVEDARESVSFFQNNNYQQMEITNPERYDIKSALVYDMSGKVIFNKANIGSVRNFNLSTSNIADGVYLIKLITTENIEIDYKMIIRNR